MLNIVEQLRASIDNTGMQRYAALLAYARMPPAYPSCMVGTDSAASNANNATQRSSLQSGHGSERSSETRSSVSRLTRPEIN